jgi:CDP-diacylglycerol pyrophosphatase
MRPQIQPARLFWPTLFKLTHYPRVAMTDVPSTPIASVMEPETGVCANYMMTDRVWNDASLLFGANLVLLVFLFIGGSRGFLSPALAQSPSAPSWCRGLDHPNLSACGPVRPGGQSTAPSLGSNEPALDPNALWTIVNGICVPNEQQYGDPTPCAAVDLTQGVERGYAVIKDPFGPTQYLLVPTRRITGIEDAALLAPDAVNYFAAAWNARSFVDKAVGRELPDDALSLAVNSPLARSQNQLHIHIDCIHANVRSALARDSAKISERWSLLDTPLGGHRFQAIRAMGTTLAGHNPFKLLAEGVPGARAVMGQRTLVVAGMNFAGEQAGFVILADRVDLQGKLAGGSRLQDHSCALARQTPN